MCAYTCSAPVFDGLYVWSMLHVYASTFHLLAFVYTMRRCVAVCLRIFTNSFQHTRYNAIAWHMVVSLAHTFVWMRFGMRYVFWFSEGEKPFCRCYQHINEYFRYVIADSVLGFCDNNQTSAVHIYTTDTHLLTHTYTAKVALAKNLKF